MIRVKGLKACDINSDWNMFTLQFKHVNCAYQAVNCNLAHKGLINRVSKFEGVMTIKR